MTKKQLEKLTPNEKIFAWLEYDEGAVEIKLCSPILDDYVTVKKVYPKDKHNVPTRIPISHIFKQQKDCEKHCLLTEEEYNSFSEVFQNIHTFIAHLLLNSTVGHQASEGELDALVERASSLLGCNAYEMLADYSDVVFNGPDEQGENGGSQHD